MWIAVRQDKSWVNLGEGSAPGLAGPPSSSYVEGREGHSGFLVPTGRKDACVNSHAASPSSEPHELNGAGWILLFLSGLQSYDIGLLRGNLKRSPWSALCPFLGMCETCLSQILSTLVKAG